MDNTTLRKLQLVEVEILDEIVRICEKYSITYYLVGGTLLGAVRHKGFIPWDDDIDIAMPREEYHKFKEICANELDDKYFLQNFETEPLYWITHSKIRKNGTFFEEEAISNLEVHKGIFVDIFVLDNASDERSFLQDIQALIYKVIMYVIRQKVNIISHDERKFEQKLFKLLVKPLLLLDQKKLHNIINTVMIMNKDPESKYYVNLGSLYGHRKATIPKDKYYPPVKIEFEGKTYNAPQDWEYYLNRLYGDYMRLPAEEKRSSHHRVMRIHF